MKYRTRKIIEHVVDVAFLVIVAISIGYLFLKMRTINNINYKRLYRKAERLPRTSVSYYDGAPQNNKINLNRDHNVFIGDLEFEGVDPLASDEFEDGVWNEAKVVGFKSYYKGDKKLTPSSPLTIVDYIDDNFDYELQTKRYNELLEDVRKPLEYKNDGKKKDKKSGSRWGRKGKEEQAREKEKKKAAKEKKAAGVVTPPPLEFSLASDLYKKALADLQEGNTNSYPTKLVTRPADASYLGRQGVSPQGVWADDSLTKIYIVPLGVHKVENYEQTSALLDAVTAVLKQDPYHSFSWPEVEYFERWYHYKEADERTAIKDLVTSGQLEFLLGGWSLLETENVLVEEIINQYEEAQRWLFEEFGYRCPIAYLKPTTHLTLDIPAILHEGGVEMLIVDDVEESIYNTLLSQQSIEFLWETNPFLAEESRLFTHVSGSTSSSLWSLIRRVLNNENGAVGEFISQVKKEVTSINDNRYLLLWPIEDGTDYSNLYTFVNTISAVASEHQLLASGASAYRYLLDVHGSEFQFPAFNYEQLRTHEASAASLYTNQPLLYSRVHHGTRFLSIFERFYAYCSMTGSCSNVPSETPDAEFYSGNNYYPTGKPNDLVYYNLHRTRRLQASVLQNSILFNSYDPVDREASRIYNLYHKDLLTFEKQAGRMFATLVGIGERVSPNEFDEDSIYSIYHRTVEWTKKKEIGVMVFNTFPTRSREYVRIRVATSDLCAFNGKMKARHQMTQISPDEYEIVLSVKLPAHSYTVYVLRWCEGNDKLEGESTPVEGKFMDGDTFRVQYDTFGRFTNVTSKLDSVFYDFEMEVGVVTPISAEEPTLYKPHGLPPSDPYYLNPFIKRLIPSTEPITHTGLRGSLMNVFVQQYGDYVNAITRFVRAVGADKKSPSRIQLLDCSFNVKQKPKDGDLVVYVRFKDIHNNHRIHTDVNGRHFMEHELESIAEEPTHDFFLNNMVSAGTAAYIQDEDMDRSKADISRVMATFGTPRGVTTMEEGSMVFPLTVGGKISKAKQAKQADQEDQEDQEDTVKQYDMNRGYQHIALSIQHSSKGLLQINEKAFPAVTSRTHFYMYYNNTKENKDNNRLKLTANLMKSNLPSQMQLMTFKKINSLQNQYLIRLQNMAEWNDAYETGDNIVTVDMAAICQALKLKMVEEVSPFGVTSQEMVEQQRFIWTAKDGKSTSGSVRKITNPKTVTFFPLQIRTFVLSK